MKYYIYISDTKVDMLFAQIPRNILKKISADLSINLGMVSVSLKEKQSEQTRYDKVNVVSNYINEHLEVGDVDNPKTYFKGTMPMRSSGEKGFVYFSGKTEHTILGLGDSLQHLFSGGRAETLLEGPAERLEFLARRLGEGSYESKHILLGSPIYVAYAD